MSDRPRMLKPVGIRAVTPGPADLLDSLARRFPFSFLNVLCRHCVRDTFVTKRNRCITVPWGARSGGSDGFAETLFPIFGES